MSATQDFVGTWSLVSYHALAQDGSKVYPMGQDLAGRITYDDAGRMAVQVMRRDRAPFSTDDPLDVSPDEARAGFAGYIAYYGTYTVDPEAGTVTHHLEVASTPNWVGSDQLRRFSFSDDRLTLSTLPMVVGGVEVTSVLEWVRERP